MIGAPSTTSSKQPAPHPHTYTTDYSAVPAEGINFDGVDFERWLVGHFKVEGKMGQLGEEVRIGREGGAAAGEEEGEGEQGKLKIVAKQAVSKRYLRSLTKRYLRASYINTSQYAPVISVHADGKTNDLVLRYRKDLPLRPCRYCKCGNRKEGA